MWCFVFYKIISGVERYEKGFFMEGVRHFALETKFTLMTNIMTLDKNYTHIWICIKVDSEYTDYFYKPKPN